MGIFIIGLTRKTIILTQTANPPYVQSNHCLRPSVSLTTLVPFPIGLPPQQFHPCERTHLRNTHAAPARVEHFASVTIGDCHSGRCE